MKKLLQQALRPVGADAEPARDLWPAMLRRLDEESVTPVRAGFNWAWFDGALAAGLVVIVASFPAAIPLVLYYL
jgi:hypothetical protein